MHTRALAGILALSCLLSSTRAASAADDVTLFRVFLRDGTPLVSYGEYARVGDRVVFSMPTSAAKENPPLQLVNIAASRVDWERTARYAESARATHYVATQAEADYAAVSNHVASTLNAIAQTTDASKRLEIVRAARQELADWPQQHYFYRAAEVRQMLTLLDDAIQNLRVASGGERFDLSLVAWTAPPPRDPVLPPPTPREAIEQVLAAARAVDSPAERVSLLESAVASLNHDAAVLPSAWLAETRTAAEAAIARDVATDRAYQAFTQRTVAEAGRRARLADVRGVQRLLDDIPARDAALGRARPEAVDALIAAVQEQLDAARTFRLARDRWIMRASVLRKYRLAIAAPMEQLESLAPALEDIKALAGSVPAAADGSVPWPARGKDCFMVHGRMVAPRIETLSRREGPGKGG